MELHPRTNVHCRSAHAGREHQGPAKREDEVCGAEKGRILFALCPRRKYVDRPRLPLPLFRTDRRGPPDISIRSARLPKILECLRQPWGDLPESGTKRAGPPELPEIRRAEPAQPERYRGPKKTPRPEMSPGGQLNAVVSVYIGSPGRNEP